MSEGAFRTAFTRTTGSSPRRYLEERRMTQAALALVETDRTVAEIAQAVGYDDLRTTSAASSVASTALSPRAHRGRALAHFESFQ